MGWVWRFIFFISQSNGLRNNLFYQEKYKNYFEYFDSFFLTGMKIYKNFLKNRFPVLLHSRHLQMLDIT